MTVVDGGRTRETGRRLVTPAGVRDVVGRYAVLIVLVLFTVVFCLARPDTFATTGNFKAIISSQAVMLLLALAATVPLRAGDFDVSVAAVMAFSGAIAAELITHGTPLGVAILVVIAMGIVVGLFNGLLVVIVGVDSFVATLATMTALGGLTYAVTSSDVVAGLPSNLTDLAKQQVLGLPIAVFYGWALVLVLWYVYERTPIGRYLLFIGGGRDTALLAGIPVRRLRMATFVTSAVISALAGIVLIGGLGAMDPGIGPQYLLGPFAAAFLGATTIHVGRFNAVGTLLALYLLSIGVTGLQLLGVAFWVSDVFNGVALIAAVVVARLVQRRGARLA